MLPAKWRMAGGIEGINGVLLCGLSTAFLFAIVNNMFQSRWRDHSGGWARATRVSRLAVQLLRKGNGP